MKKILLFIAIFFSVSSYGQQQSPRFPTVDSLQNYILRYIRNSTVESFTNLRMQNVVYGLSEYLGGTGSFVDSVTASNDSLIYWKSGVSYYVTSFSDASAGGDTTIFEIILDSTGQQNQRVLFSKNRKISSDSRFLFDDVNDKLVINGANVSVGGASTKLWVGGNGNINGTLAIGTTAATTDTTTYKPLVIGTDRVVRRLSSWPTGGSYTAGNGLTLSGSQFKLGGTINEATNIPIAYGNSFRIRSLNQFGGDSAWLQIDTRNSGFTGSAGFYGSGTFRPKIAAQGSQLYFGNDSSYLNVQNAGMQFFDNRSVKKGIEYNFNDTTGFQNQTLITKQYLNQRLGTIGGTTYTAGNGLTLSGSQFKFGGSLTASTALWNNPFKYSYAVSGTDSVVVQTTFSPSFRVDRYASGIANNLIVGNNMYFEASNGSGQAAGLEFSNTGSSISTNFNDTRTVKKGLEYNFTDTTGFGNQSLITKQYLNQRLGSFSPSTPTLQQVTDAGNTTTNSIKIGDTLYFNNPPAGAYGYFWQNDTEQRFYHPTNSYFGFDYSTNNFYAIFSKSNLTQGQTLRFPDSTGTVPVAVYVNGTRYNTNTNGTIDLGTIGGSGISDTSRIVTTDKTQSITGRKTFNAATFINKDSLPITTGKRWGIVVDTANNGRLQRQDLNIYRRDLDTIPLATFTVGSAAAGDTAAFSTSTLAGSFYLDGTDTLFVTSYRVALQGTSPSITPEVWFNDSLNVTAGGTRLATGSAITNTTTGTNVTATTNKIPQGNWVFVRFSAVTTKPTYFTLTLFGYRIRKQ